DNMIDARSVQRPWASAQLPSMLANGASAVLSTWITGEASSACATGITRKKTVPATAVPTTAAIALRHQVKHPALTAARYLAPALMDPPKPSFSHGPGPTPAPRAGTKVSYAMGQSLGVASQRLPGHCSRRTRSRGEP